MLVAFLLIYHNGSEDIYRKIFWVTSNNIIAV